MKLFFLVLTLSSLTACGKHDGLKSFEWTPGSSSQSLNQISSETFKVASLVDTKFDRIEILNQKIGSAVVSGSYFKKVYDKNGSLVYAAAAFTEDKKGADLQAIDALELQKDSVVSELQSRYPQLRKFEFEKPELVLDQKASRLELLWQVVYFDSKGLAWQLKVSPLYKIKSVDRVGSQFHAVPALVFPSGPKYSALQEVILNNLVGDGTLSSQTLKVSTLSSAKLSISDSAKYNPPDERFDQVQVYFFINSAINWFNTNLGVRLPQALDVQVHVGYPEKTNTAFYYQNRIRVGTGDDVTYTKIPLDPSVITHETCHALVEAIARLPFEGEGGSINEGYADFITATQLNRPNMGEVAYLKGPFRRTVDNDLKLQSKNGGLYHDSGIVSGTLWSLHKKIGSPKAVELAMKTLSQLNPQSDLNDFGKKLQLAVDASLTGKEHEAAAQIMRDRGWL